MTPSSVCFGTTGDSPGIFSTPATGEVITFKLIYQSGYLQCYNGYRLRWGCIHPVVPKGYSMGTVITDAQKTLLLPKTEFRYGGDWCGSRDYYNLTGQTPDAAELLFDNFSVPLNVSVGSQFQIWFVEDLNNCWEEGNDNGKTCAEVHALFV